MLGYYSLLAKLEDDEELPVGDKVEENEEDCDDSEDFEEGVGAIREVKENLQRDETSLPFSRRNSSLPVSYHFQHKLLHGRGAAVSEAALL